MINKCYLFRSYYSLRIYGQKTLFFYQFGISRIFPWVISDLCSGDFRLLTGNVLTRWILRLLRISLSWEVSDVVREHFNPSNSYLIKGSG